MTAWRGASALVALSALLAVAAGAMEEEANITYYEVYQKLQLNCTLPNPENKPYLWRKNGTAVAELADVKARYRLDGALFTIPPKTTEDDFGTYSCNVGDAAQSWVVHGQPHVKLPANTNVVEGEKMKLQCRVIGKPHLNVTWSFINGGGGNGTPVLEALAGRAELGGVLGEELVLHNTSLTDAGRYVCAVDDRAKAETVVRVKDMYAALWPFLGICAEVFVLCAVILVYERRRTKPELDDSDTDNHDQKKS